MIVARKTVTTYTCDGCGEAASRPKDLRRFFVEVKSTAYRNPPVSMDVCEACEDKLLGAVAKFCADENQDALADLRRKS